MKIKKRSAEECVTIFEIEVPKESVGRAFEEVYDEISKVASIPGFRPGKAPRELVKKQYAKDAESEMLQRVIPESYKAALGEHGIFPVGLPEITDVSCIAGGPVSFKAKVETRPQFKLKNYKGIKVEKKKIPIQDEDVAKAIENLREISAKYVTQESGAAEMGDYVVSDMECFVEDKPAHKKRENLWLCLNTDTAVPGLSEKLVGIKPGEERDVEVTLPAEYPDKAIAGKAARYHIKSKEVKMRQLPDVNDDFAKDLGKGSLEELKKDILDEMTRRAAVNIEVDAENQLLKKLMDDNLFSVPASFVQRQLEYMIEDAKRRLSEKGVKKEDLDKKEGDFRAKFKDDAVRQVRLLFILDEIAREEKIEAAEEEIKEAFKSISAQTGKSEEEVRNYYESQELVESLKDRIREGKTIKFLLANADIVEK